MSQKAVTSFSTSVKALINNNKKTGGNGDGLRKNHFSGICLCYNFSEYFVKLLHCASQNKWPLWFGDPVLDFLVMISCRNYLRVGILLHGYVSFLFPLRKCIVLKYDSASTMEQTCHLLSVCLQKVFFHCIGLMCNSCIPYTLHVYNLISVKGL